MDVIALDLGELRIALELDNDRLRAGMAQTKRELETLPPVARREMVKVSRVADEEGRKSGSLLAQGVRSGFIRNSPLIAAAVGGALAAGAPLVTAGAGLMFAGVGAVAAAQTMQVREAWTSLGRDIRDSAVEDSRVLIPVYTEMAERIGAAFRNLRPQIQEAFAESAPLIQSFTGGVIALAENAMPGLVRAVAAGEPVFAGFEHFLGATGSGLTEFFDAISGHAGAAGQAFAGLGDTVATLLPLLGELLGQGAELAADVLPLLNTGLGLVLGTVRLLGPALPVVAAGFLAFKAAGAVGGILTNFAGGLQRVAVASGRVDTETGRANGGLGRMRGGLLAVSAAAGPLGLAVGGVVTAIHAHNQALDEFEARASSAYSRLGEGGVAAEQARQELALLEQAARDVGDGFGNVWSDEHEQRLQSARAEVDRLEAAMTPLERAQRDVGAASDTLAAAIERHGPGSREAAAASEQLTAKQEQLARAQAELEYATQGVTSAMIEQANQALAAIDSGFAYRNSVDQLEDAQANLEETIRNRTSADENLRTTEEDVARAQLALEEQAYRTALAFGQQQADLSGLSTDSAEYARILQEQTLVKLYELQAAAGPEMAAAIGQQIAQLEASGVALSTTGASADTVAQKMRDLGITVTQMPGNKSIFIDAPTAEQKQRLQDLGLTVRTLPNGRIWVTADTSPAAGTLAAFMNQRRVIQIQAQLNTGGVRYQGAGQQPTRAEGGPVWPGQTFLVGEEGPELVRFGGHGTVIPADETARITAAAEQPRQLPAPSLQAPSAERGERALVSVGTMNLVEGTPEDLAQRLAYQMRLGG